MGPIRDPPTFPFDILSRRDRRRRADHCHEALVAAAFHAQDATARLFTVEGHALDCTSEVFRRRETGWRLHSLDTRSGHRNGHRFFAGLAQA